MRYLTPAPVRVTIINKSTNDKYWPDRACYSTTNLGIDEKGFSFTDVIKVMIQVTLKQRNYLVVPD